MGGDVTTLEERPAPDPAADASPAGDPPPAAANEQATGPSPAPVGAARGANTEAAAPATADDAVPAAEAEKAPAQAAPAPAREWAIAPSQVDFDDPLLVCLSLLTGLMRRPVSPPSLIAGLPIAGGKLTPEFCLRAAQRVGLRARIVHRPAIAKIPSVALPCILLLKEGNACLLLAPVDETRVKIGLPEAHGGTEIVSIRELQAIYTGNAIFAKTEFAFDARAADARVAGTREWFWGTLWSFWPIYSHVILASVVINAAALASPLFIMNVYDRVVPNVALETLWALALGVGIVFLFEFAIRNLRSYFVDVAGKNADVIIANDLLRQILAMRLDKKPGSIGGMASNMREFEGLRDFFTSGTLIAFVDLPFIVLFLFIIAMIGGTLAIVPLLAVPLIVGAGYVLQFPLLRVVESGFRESTQKHSLLVEAIEGLETIKTAGAEGHVQSQWERFVGATAETSRKARIIATLSTTFSQAATQVVSVGVVVYGVYLIADGSLTTGALVASTLLVGRTLAPLGAMAAMLTRFQQSRVALKALDQMMRTPVERPVGKAFVHRPRLGGDIEFRKISFRYPSTTVQSLDAVSFRLKPGERVGIIGRIGSGKSTIARLLLGLYEPAQGAIYLDGVDQRQIDPADLRRNIGYVAQDNYLFFGSVRDNICIGAPNIDDATLLRAATLAGVTEFVAAHPQGFDMQVGERGMGLSGGQRQAITIARALLLDPPLVLLDEPTSAMDNASEAAFRARLELSLSGKTMMLVTHRSSLLALVGRLIVLDNGRIVADGPRDEVLAALRQGHIRAASAS